MALERGEYRWLRDFVASPYFNKHQEVAQLCYAYLDLLARFAPDSDFASESVFTLAFPRVAFDEKKYAYLASDLLRLGEQFLAQRRLEADSVTLSLQTLQALNERGLEKAYQANYRQLRKKLASPASENTHTLYQHFELSELAGRHFDQSSTERTASPFLQDAADQLDSAYLAAKFRLNCAMLNTQEALNHEYTFRFTEAADLAAIKGLPRPALAQLYFQCFCLLQTENRQDLLNEFTTLIRTHASTVATPEITDLFYYAINYVIRQIRLGHRNYAAILLELYQTGLDDHIILEDGLLSPWNYKNIVKLGLGLRQFDWVENFVNQYTDALPAADREDARHFNLADIAYHRKDFARALHHLQQAEFSDIHYALGAKAMLIKVYYETAAEEALLSLLFSFRLFLIRNKQLAPATKDVYLNFIRLTKKLYQLKSREQAQKLQAAIKITKALSDRSWLLQQISTHEHAA